MPSRNNGSFSGVVMEISVSSSSGVDIPQQLSPITSAVLSQQVSNSSSVQQLSLAIKSEGGATGGNGRCDNGMIANGGMRSKLASGKTPTCRVCGDESSGYHYGVDSCEGCKGFFRRCITQGMTHKCSNEEKCDITPFTRNSCQYCRLKKCFAVGMSREASRLGRRPKRLKDSSGEQKREANVPIAPYPTSPSELYKLRMAELQKLLQQNGQFKSELMQAFLQAAQHSFREHQRNNNTNDNQKNKKNAVNRPGSEPSYSPSLTPGSVTSPLDQSDVLNQNNRQSVDSKVGIIESGLDNFKLGSDPSSPIQLLTTEDIKTENVTSPTDIYSTSEIKTEIPLDNSQYAPMTDNSNVMPSFPPSGCASPMFQMPELSPETMMMMPDMMEMMKDMDPQMMMMEGGMPPMPDPSMMSFAEPDANANEIDVERILEEVKQVPSALRQQLIETVIDQVSKAHMETVTPTRAKVNEAEESFRRKMIEGLIPDFARLSINPKQIWQKFISNMVFEVTQVVRFCKKLPGFSEIHQEDQIVLIKKGSFEILLNRMCLLVDHEKMEMFDPGMEMKCPKEMVQKMPMGMFVMEFFNVAAQMNPLKLTDEEIGIFSACLIMCPEREGLENVLAVEKLHTLFLQSMFFEVRKNHNDFENKFARLLGIMPVFRQINQKHSAMLNAMKMQKDPVIEEYPALPKEIYEIDEKA